MYCMKCGNLLEQDAAFCGACGQAVGAAAAASAPPPTVAPTAAPPVQVTPAPAVAVAAPLAFPYAGFWLRLAAYLIDGAVMSIPFGAVVLAFVLLLGGVSYLQGVAAGLNGPNPAFPPALILAFFAVFAALFAATWLYYAFMESSSHQGTLGKMALGLTVADMQGRRISFGRASGRFFAKMITGMVPLAIGYIMAGFTEKKQALHDMIASCLVLKKI